mgnify:CR=1 FL=1
MGENVKHFTSEQKDENTYGWPWNEVVKKYLESGYASEQKECQVTIREKEYKILKRDAVTVLAHDGGHGCCWGWRSCMPEQSVRQLYGSSTIVRKRSMLSASTSRRGRPKMSHGGSS